MKILDNIPGFKTKQKTINIIATIYYAFFIGIAIGSSSVKMALAYGSLILIPFIIDGAINTVKLIKNKEYKPHSSIIRNISFIAIIIFSWSINLESSIIKKDKLEQYKNLTKQIEQLNIEDSKYYDENSAAIKKYLDLQVKYEEVQVSFDEYKKEHPETLVEEVKQAKDDVNKLYENTIELENKVKEVEIAKEKEKEKENAKNESQQANSSNNTNVSSNSSNTSSSGSSSESSSNNNSSENKHIGKNVYISNGNSYYHAISNCKYLEGAPTSVVTLTSSMRKYECNCWTNPIVYKPSSNSNSSTSGGSSSSGKTVYIASGNSYYHKSPSCKFLNGASASAVDLNNVGGKHACNCVKY